MSAAIQMESPSALWGQPPGLKRRYRLRATHADDGLPVDIPVVVITGPTAGPRVVVIVGVHGDEVEGQLALQHYAEALEPDDLIGTLAMVLCANPLAALQGQRRTPEDGEDLNRVFPGDPEGSLSYRLAASLFAIVREAAFLMTLHSWYATGEVLPYVEYSAARSPAAEAGRRAACACGLERIMPLDWLPGLLPAAAVRSGVPAIEIEIGGMGQSTPLGLELYRRTIQNVLGHAGIVHGPPQDPARIATIRGHHLLSPASGILRLHIALGENVYAGQRLASVVSLDGQTQTELVAPASGEVGAVRRFAPVQEGDHIAAVFETIHEDENQ